MQTSFLQNNNSSRLLLIFSGWSTDESLFGNIICPGYDIAVVSNYSTIEEISLPKEYREVVVMAWSLGVKAAELSVKKLPVTLSIAVNGTSFPADNDRGIPFEIYRKTAENLNECNLLKFHKRMGADGKIPASRSIESLKNELINFPSSQPSVFRWDRAIISSNDKIFPAQNQRNAWANKAEITEISGNHLPDFQKIINRFVINKSLVENRFAQSRDTYNSRATIQERIAGHLFELWQKHGFDPSANVLEIGAGSGIFTQFYASKLRKVKPSLWDITPDCEHPDIRVVDAEEEIVSVPDCEFDVIASASTIQWFNSIPAFLIQAQRILKNNGLLVLSTFGPQTFTELSQAGVIPLPYFPQESYARIIPPQLEMLELHSGLITKVFDTPLAALKYLRETGVNSRPATCPVRQIINNYPRRNDGRVSLTYQPIYIILRKK